MKRTVIFLMAGLFITENILSQSAFVDAKSLSLKYPEDSIINISIDSGNFLILRNYTGIINPGPSDIIGSFRDNPFIRIIENRNVKADKLEFIARKINENKGFGFQPEITAFPNMTTLVDGLSRFIVKRTKEELNIAFFEKFRSELAEYPDLLTIFPATCHTLMVIGDEIYNYQNYLTSLRESFISDLSALPSNLPKIIGLHSKYFEDKPEMKAWLINAFYLADCFRLNMHPGQIIENYDLKLAEFDPRLKAPLQTLKLFSGSLRNAEGSYWASYASIKQMLDDEIIFRIYLGLIYQKAKIEKIVFPDGKTLDSKINETYKQWKEYKPYLLKMALIIEALNNEIETLNTENDISIAFEKYYNIASLTIDLIGFVTEIDDLPPFKSYTLGLSIKLGPMLDLSKYSTRMAVDIRRKNYRSAVVNSVLLFKSSYEYFKNCKSDYDVETDKILKYGTFMASIAQAGSSDEVEAVIESLALPAGSSRIKRESAFNISLNAYCGLFAGQTRTYLWSRPDYAYGLTVPLGVAASLGGKKHNSISAFFSVIDIAAPTAFRFTNDTANIAEIRLKDIISPGIFLSFGLGKTPISFNGGFQLTPLLQKSGTDENTFQKKMLRFSLSACVDIPLLNLYTRNH